MILMLSAFFASGTAATPMGHSGALTSPAPGAEAVVSYFMVSCKLCKLKPRFLVSERSKLGGRRGAACLFRLTPCIACCAKI